MIMFERVFKDDRMMRGITGLNLVEFETLLPTFERILIEKQNNPVRE